MSEKKESVSITSDSGGKKVVVISDIIFKGRQNIDWIEVEDYLKRYIGEIIEVADTSDVIYIGNDFPDEYTGSKYTARLKGTLAKAKANMAQGVPQIVEIASNRRFKNNLDEKHSVNARNGWYRYNSRVALPIFSENGVIERYNVFSVELIVRHSADGKLYLYDMINIKKETGTPHWQ